MKLWSRTVTRASLALILAAACSSTGNNTRLELRGTVDRVDTNAKTITLTNVENHPNGKSSATIHYREDTPVRHEARSYKPENLERGDEIVAMVERSGDRFNASSVTVVRDVRAATAASTPPDKYANAIRATVRTVDSSARTIQVDRGALTADIITVVYDTKTILERDGQPRGIADLQRGDEVDINLRSGATTRTADSINIVRGANDAPTVSKTPARSDLRGTVTSVNARARTIMLGETIWGRSFTANKSGEAVSVQFDDRTLLEFRGRRANPSGLERGDVIDIELRSGSIPYVAERIWIVRDVRSY